MDITGYSDLTAVIALDEQRERLARAAADQRQHEAATAGAVWRRALATALVALAARLAPASQGAPAPRPTAAR